MVKSIIDGSITYVETTKIDATDMGHDAVQFEIELFPDTEASIALGNIRYTYADKGVLYIPVYLLKGDAVVEQIGVYEFPTALLTQLLDEDNDFDITRLDNPLPLYYTFFNQKFLEKVVGKKKLKKVEPKDASDEPEDALDELGDALDELEDDVLGEFEDDALEDFSDVDSDKWTSPNKPTVLDEILGQESNPGDAISERESYKPNKRDVWVQKYMKSSQYSLLDNEGKGDCFFAVIRDAYKGIPEDMSVKQLRGLISDAATQKIFDDFKEQYDMYNSEIIKTKKAQVDIVNELKTIKGKFNGDISRNEKKDLISQANILTKNFKIAKKENANAKILISDYLWLASITDLSQFKAKLKTCKFWAEAWAINTLERILNIKIIILSKENYENGDTDNVLQCGSMVDNEIESKGSFDPKHYIIAAYSGDHYMLVKYKTKRIFNFETLPHAIKELIVEKCMEKIEGIYNMIPKFKNMKQNSSMNQLSEDLEIVELPKADTGAEDFGMREMEKFDEGLESMKDVKFNKDIVFQFSSKSSGKPSPGKGAGEKIGPSDAVKFAELVSIKDWRKVLSNFSKGEFNLDGKKWLTVEHFYHASKFKNGNPEFAEQFSLDSGSDISKDPAMAKGAGGKTGKFKKNQIRPKNIKLDTDFFDSKENERAMYRGQMAKYSQVPLAKQVLLATKDAKLHHFSRGSPPIVFYDSMKIREILSK
jgi:predicted NAD-dependent protein-ADP-ribosyltransferase YbiA (DUF1768 family)|tara:strand:- start:163 stop:2283 length:2121 start_codon:yes stop_codon:yes gene_type:complete